MDSNAIFLQLAAVLGLSAVFGYIIKILKQPLIVAYLLVGVILSLFQLFDLTKSETFTFLPEVGIALVLFFVGMELDLKEIKHLGKPIIAASLGQIFFSILAGFIIAVGLGFSQTESFFMGVGLAFSSTIVVVKLLLEKKDLNSLYGKLSVGILLLEDLVAILLLMGMTVGTSMLNLGLQNSLPLVSLILKGAFLFVLSLGLSKYVLERVFKAMAVSSELLFLSAVAWCFVFVALSILLGFSVVIGAFLAGVALANSPFHFEIQGKVKPLRDFFVTVFFVYLGTQVVFQDLQTVLPLMLIFTTYALVIKPIIFLLILGAFGFRRHTIFQTAINLSQISEFSLIVLVVGLKTGMVSQAALTAMALTGVISIIVSSILISSSKPIYKKLVKFIGFFEHTNFIHKIETKADETLENHVIIIGAHRMGGEIVNFFKSAKTPFLVMDFNPKVIQALIEDKIKALYGDLGDPEVLDFLNLEKASLIISTASQVEDNLLLLSEVKRRRVKAPVITRATTTTEAASLYKAGADYVILPEIVSGIFVTQSLKTHWPNLDFFKDRSSIELPKLSHNHLAEE